MRRATTALLMALGLSLTAHAAEGMPSEQTLAEMGLGGLQILSDSDALAIRGSGFDGFDQLRRSIRRFHKDVEDFHKHVREFQHKTKHFSKDSEHDFGKSKHDSGKSKHGFSDGKHSFNKGTHSSHKSHNHSGKSRGGMKSGHKTGGGKAW